MLIEAKTLKNYRLQGKDGELGKVKEFYFDDHYWTIRYLVAETWEWLSSKKVLISPYAINNVNKKEEYLNVDLTRKQIEDGPTLNADVPVSQQFEDDYYKHYGWPMYYYGSEMWGFNPHIERNRDSWKNTSNVREKKVWDRHLRSTQEVSGYNIQATDGEIGHVEDFVIDEESWAVRYLIVDTVNWWPGKKVLISPQWIKNINWHESKVFINLSRERIKLSPEYTTESLLTRDYEAGLYKHYKHKGYWSNEKTCEKNA